MCALTYNQYDHIIDKNFLLDDRWQLNHMLMLLSQARDNSIDCFQLTEYKDLIYTLLANDNILRLDQLVDIAACDCTFYDDISGKENHCIDWKCIPTYVKERYFPLKRIPSATRVRRNSPNINTHRHLLCIEIEEEFEQHMSIHKYATKTEDSKAEAIEPSSVPDEDPLNDCTSSTLMLPGSLPPESSPKTPTLHEIDTVNKSMYSLTVSEIPVTLELDNYDINIIDDTYDGPNTEVNYDMPAPTHNYNTSAAIYHTTSNSSPENDINQYNNRMIQRSNEGDFDSVSKRHKHNTMEKVRRKYVSSAFRYLGRALDFNMDKKPSKATLLTKAREKIRSLNEKMQNDITYSSKVKNHRDVLLDRIFQLSK